MHTVRKARGLCGEVSMLCFEGCVEVQWVKDGEKGILDRGINVHTGLEGNPSFFRALEGV